MSARKRRFRYEEGVGFYWYMPTFSFGLIMVGPYPTLDAAWAPALAFRSTQGG